MKKSRLPATPLEALNISPALGIIVKIVHQAADWFRFWESPREKAAADIETMNLLDKLYWGYKSKKPIRRAADPGLETVFADRQQGISLPPGFEKKISVTLAAVGDLYKIDGIENSKDILYEKIAQQVFNRDISVANLESQVTRQPVDQLKFSDKEAPPLHGPEAQYDAMKGHRGSIFTVMQTANNHTLDMGIEGVETTQELLKKDAVIDLGTNLDKTTWGQGRIIEKNGIKTGFISATYGLNGKPVPAGKEYLVNVVKFHQQAADGSYSPDLSLLEKQIEFCKAHGCDFIIACLHWGYEYEFYPRQHQIDIAHDLIESGVDLIIGHHAHVIQPVEFYTSRRDPRRTAVIAYSLGNLTSPFSAPHLVRSQILDITIAKGILQGQEKTYIEKAGITTVIQAEDEMAGKPVFRIEPLDRAGDTV